MKYTIKPFVGIIAFAVPALFILAPEASLQTKPPVETAGQKFKSIKVLNDMPADQMGKVMNMMAASLGVQCKYCHASNDSDFEKEGIEHKDAARAMLKMTFDINKNFFEGRPEVSCNTCHNGVGHPQPGLNLYPVPVEPRPAQPATKPTVGEILAKYASAIGKGEVRSRKITAQRIEADGKTTEPEEIVQSGSKMRTSTTYGTTVVTEMFDGAKATKFTGAGLIELKPDEAEQIRREAQIFGNADLRSIYPKLEFRFLDKIDGRDAHMVLATNADNSRERLFFDVQTGLLIRRVASAQTVIGPFQYQIDYLDYKDFGGVKIPTTVKFAVPNIRFTRKLIDVKINAPVGETVFAND
jgi:hypothetical protein